MDAIAATDTWPSVHQTATNTVCGRLVVRQACPGRLGNWRETTPRPPSTLSYAAS